MASGAKRAPKGAGSVYQTTINGQLMWCASMEGTDKATGKKWRVRGFGGSRGQALERRNYNLTRKTGAGVLASTPRSIRLSAYLPTYVKNTEKRLAPQTKAKYLNNLQHHFFAYLDPSITSITTQMLREHFEVTLVDAGVGPSAIEHTMTNLSGLLNHLARDENHPEFIQNPMEGLKNTREKKLITQRQRDDDRYVEKRTNIARGLINWLEDPANPYHEHHTRFLLMMLGIRRSELMALSYRNCSSLKTKDASITISQQLHHATGRGYYIHPATKSGRDRRVPLSIGFRKAILAEKNKGNVARDEWVREADLILLRPLQAGGYTHYSDTYYAGTYAEILATYMKKPVKGFTKDPDYFRPHFFRHIALCRMFHNGTDIHTAAAIIGDGVDVAQETYLHLAREHKLSAVKGLELGLSKQQLKKA